MKNYYLKSQIRLLFLATLITGLFSCLSENEFKQNIVYRGDFKSSQIETGELVAVNSKGISIPFIGWKYGHRYKITELASHGDIIHKGEIVAKIDPSSVVRVLEEEQNKLEIELANLKKIKARQESQLSQLKSEFDREDANYKLIQLQVDKFKFEPDRKQKIKALEQEIAEIKLERVKRKITLQKVIIQNELNIQKTKITQIENNVSAAERALSKLVIKSPIAGIVQLEENWRTDKMVQLGDELGQGWPMASIPDMSSMKVSATINESDIYKISLDQKVNVRLDAYPEKSFSGKISYIGRLSRNKERDNPIKVFDFEVSVIEEDPALKPGMTVSCEILLSELENTLYVKNNCVYRDSSGFFIIPTDKKNEGRIPVEVVGANNDFTAIKGNVSKGLKIIAKSKTTSLNELD